MDRGMNGWIKGSKEYLLDDWMNGRMRIVMGRWQVTNVQILKGEEILYRYLDRQMAGEIYGQKDR